MKKHQAFRAGIAVAAALLGLFPNIATARAAAKPALIGDWQGAIDTGNTSLRIVLHIAQDKDLNLTATMDSPDQGATGIAVSSISFKQPDLHFEIESIGGAYEGKINEDGTEFSGTWKQGSASLPLNLKRAGK